MNFSDAVPAPRLHKLEVLANYDVDNLVTVEPEVMHDVPFNWKIMVENFMEMYHNSRLHNGIHDFAPSSGAWYEDYEAGDGALFGFNQMVEPDGGFNPTFKALFPPLPGITMEERQRIVFAFVPPTLLLGFQPDSAFWFAVDPTGPTSHDLSMAYTSQGQRSSARTSTRRWMKRSTVQYSVRQDMPTNVATQLGLRSRFEPAAASWREGVLAQFNSWLVERYEAASV